MYDPNLGLRTQVLPAGALPGTPRYVVGVDIPAELAAFYPAPLPMIMVQLYEKSSTNYVYDGLLANAVGVVRVQGGYDGAAVTENARMSADGRVIYGGRNSTDVFFFGGSTLQISDGSNLTIGASSPFEIDGIPAPRATVTYDAFQGALLTVTAAVETVVAVSSTGTFRNGRAFKAHVATYIGTSPIVQPAIFRIRRGNTTAGTTLCRPGSWSTILSQNANVTFVGTFANRSGADIVGPWCVTMLCPNASGANPVSVNATLAAEKMEMHAWDAGGEAEFTGANSM